MQVKKSHYLKFYRHYLNGFKDGFGEPYSSAEDILQVLKEVGIAYRVEKITYENGVSENASLQVEGYLQRCIFDDTINLGAMLNNSITGPYLKNCIKAGKVEFQATSNVDFSIKKLMFKYVRKCIQQT